VALDGPRLGRGDAVLFDMDGTLLMLPVDIDALRQRLAEHHRRYGLEMNFRPLTDDLERAARKLREMLSPAEARAAAQWAKAQVAQAEVDAVASIQPRAGMIDALEQLSLRGVLVGVVSNNTRRGIRAALEAVGIEVDGLAALVSREDVDRPKPAPDALDLGVRQLLDRGWQPQDRRLIYVGDAPSDLLAVRSMEPRHLHAQLADPAVLIVGGGRAGSGSLVGDDADWVAPDDVSAKQLLLGT
jgi:beta-phosphoglucomutase-like phosphatase (HAD superfamily)